MKAIIELFWTADPVDLILYAGIAIALAGIAITEIRDAWR